MSIIIFHSSFPGGALPWGLTEVTRPPYICLVHPSLQNTSHTISCSLTTSPRAKWYHSTLYEDETTETYRCQTLAKSQTRYRASRGTVERCVQKEEEHTDPRNFLCVSSSPHHSLPFTSPAAARPHPPPGLHLLPGPLITCSCRLLPHLFPDLCSSLQACFPVDPGTQGSLSLTAQPSPCALGSVPILWGSPSFPSP